MVQNGRYMKEVVGQLETRGTGRRAASANNTTAKDQRSPSRETVGAQSTWFAVGKQKLGREGIADSQGVSWPRI